MTLDLKEAGLQKPVLTNRNLILRLLELGEQALPVLSVAERIIVKPQEYKKALIVDQVDIGRKNRCLPREISVSVNDSEKSADVIVPRVTSADCSYHTRYGLTTWEGLNIKSRLD